MIAKMDMELVKESFEDIVGGVVTVGVGVGRSRYGFQVASRGFGDGSWTRRNSRESAEEGDEAAGVGMLQVGKLDI